jgi:hypothetical protein
MPRVKKIAKYEIDFQFPKNPRNLITKEDGSCIYTAEELLAFAAENSDTFVESVTEYYKTKGFITSSQMWTLANYGLPYTPAFAELDAKFFTWYDSRADIQELYTKIASVCGWLYDKNGKYYNTEDVKTHNWNARPESWKMFYSVMNSWEGQRIKELERDVVYDLGDLVVLRKPFVGSYRHDPCYGKVDKETERVGTVMEHTEKIHSRSRGGKGSRMINVLWISTGETKLVPERVIKIHKTKA